MKRKFYLGALFSVSLFMYSGATQLNAQNNSTLHQSKDKLPQFSQDSGFGSFYADMTPYNINEGFIAELPAWAGLDDDHTFVLVKADTDELNIKHTTYQHLYRGVTVADELISLHEKDGKLLYINGELTVKVNVSPSAAVTMADITDAVATDIGTTKLKVSNVENVLVKINDKGTVRLVSATRAEVLSSKPIRSFTYFIDNNTKAVVKKFSKQYQADVPSVSSTLFKGSQSMTVDSFTGGYRLKDNLRNIHTLDGSGLDGDIDPVTGAFTGGADYTSTTANFTANGHKPAVQVHWGMTKAYDYYTTRHNRNSYDGAGSIIRNYYDFQFSMFMPVDEGFGFNAMAVDMGSVAAMVYGNGNVPGAPGLANPVVALDVAGHEFSHLVIGRNGRGGLNYEGESGALNESVADMMGTAIEFYTGTTPNWLIGEDVLNVSPGFLRSMSNPNSGPAMLGSQQPDTYEGFFWADPTDLEDGDQGGVHTNSGVGNFWFYLLSQGGTGTNDIGNAYSVTGITIQKAEKIIYRALNTYFTPNNSYLNAAAYTKQAAIDLYGPNSAEALQTAKAWYAVGIGNGLLANKNFNLADEGVSVYPNPVANGVVTANLSIDKEASYQLYDISGKLIIPTQKLSFGNNTIPVAGVQAGVYLLKVNVGGSIASKKLIIQ